MVLGKDIMEDYGLLLNRDVMVYFIFKKKPKLN
jgi:hypothetical protein